MTPRETAPSNFIESNCSKAFNGLRTDKQRVAYAKAMYMSLRLDNSDGKPSRPRGPYLIQAECGFALKFQQQYNIVLGKSQAISFLEDFGVPVSKTSFSKRNSKKRYEEFFERKAPLLHKRRLFLTYAEWLHLEDYLFEPELPDFLKKVLPEDWKVPPKDHPQGNPSI